MQMICVILGILCVVYGIMIVSYAGVTVKFHFIWIVMGGLFFIVSAMMNKMRAGILVISPKMGIPLGIVVGAGLVFFVVVETILAVYAHQEPRKVPDAMMILGCQVRGEKVSKALKYRLDAAIPYLQAHPDVIVIVSGGQGTGEDISEAEAMDRYLVKNGVSRERIYQENQSTSTEENVRFSKSLLKDLIKNGVLEGGNTPPEQCNIVVVSNGFHMYRAIHICKKQGFVNVEGLAGSSDPRMVPAYYLREFFAVVKDYLVGNI